MSLVTNVTDLATRIATEVKALRTLINGNAADLSSLTTTSKTNLVSAINEIKDASASAAGINDATTSTTTTWSSSKTSTELGTKAPSTHSHAIADVTNLQATLDGKAATSHTHTAANVTDFQASVDARISTVLDIAGAPTTLDTLNELAAALGDDPNFATTMTTALGNRVRVDAVQAFTGPQQTQGRDNIAAASATDLSTLSTNVGDTATNFVTTFEAGLV